jgi:hypothetical protein
VAIGTNIRTLLLAQASITGELASTTACYTDKTDQNKPLPYLVITQITEDPMKVLGATTGLRATEFYIDCVATSRPGADDVADAVEAFITDYTGPAGGSTIRAVLLNDRAHDAIPVGQGTENYKFVTTLSIEVQHE